MAKSSKNMARANAVKLAELSLAAPQVVTHRLMRMANAGATLSARDRKEFTGMIVEKQIAFTQAWWGMYTEMLTLPQRTVLALLQGKSVSLPKLTNAVVAKGLAPVHRKAMSNAKRLAKTPLR